MKMKMKMIMFGLSLIVGLAVHAELPVQAAEVLLKNVRGLAVEAAPAAEAAEGETEKPSLLDTPEEEQQDALEFFNKDVLHGHLVGVNPGEGLVWQHPDAADAITFSLDNVRSVKLAQAWNDEPEDQHQVRLVNGNTISGKILALTADELTLETWYAGTVTIKRSMMAGITLSGESAPSSYMGPNSLDEWEVPAGNWRFENNVLYGLGNGLTLGKKLTLPEMARIDMEIAWQGNLNINLALLADNANLQSAQKMIGLNLNRHYISFYSKTPNRHHGHGNAQVQELMQKAQAKFTFCLDRKEKILVLFVDDKLVKEWRHNVESEEAESFLTLVANPGGGVAFRRIRVSEWDGKRGLEDIARDPEPDKDLAVFQNSDQVSGGIETIAEGQMKLETAFATMDVPLQRVKRLEFNPEKRAEATAIAGDIRVRLVNDDAVTLKLKECGETGLTGSNPAIGEIKIRKEALKELMLKMADERHNCKEKGVVNFFGD